MKISVIAASELDASLVQRWRDIQRSDETLRSPYYCPEYAQLIETAGRKVRVAVIEEGGEIKGFFPHEKDGWGRLASVGHGLNDYHGLVAVSGLKVEASKLLRACKANYFGFDHLPLTQEAFSAYVRFHSASPILELQGGWEAYVQRLCAAQNTKSPGILSTIRASSRRIERDIGPLRVVLYEKSAQVLEELMRLKAEQWRRTTGKNDDPFSVPWIRQVMEKSFASQGKQFGGVLSALYAGDKLLASHFGLRSERTLHSWFPVYDTQYAYYQPGLVLLKSIAEIGSQTDLDIIDLGRGLADYKMRFKTTMVPMGAGAVSSPEFMAKIMLSFTTAKNTIKCNTTVKQVRQWLSNSRKTAVATQSTSA